MVLRGEREELERRVEEGERGVRSREERCTLLQVGRWKNGPIV